MPEHLSAGSLELCGQFDENQKAMADKLQTLINEKGESPEVTGAIDLLTDLCTNSSFEVDITRALDRLIEMQSQPHVIKGLVIKRVRDILDKIPMDTGLTEDEVVLELATRIVEVHPVLGFKEMRDTIFDQLTELGVYVSETLNPEQSK